jgi:hypothetical protein
MSAGATKAQKIAMNKVMVPVHINYAFRVNPKDREKKAPGNVVRKLLWTADVMLDLLAARYGELSSAEERLAADRIAAVQRADEWLAEEDAEPPAPAAPSPPPAPAPSPKPPATHGYDIASLLAASAPPPTTLPTPSPPTAAGPQDDNNDDIDPDGDVDDTWEAAPDICGTYLTALRGVQTLLELQLELHEPWEDDHAGACSTHSLHTHTLFLSLPNPQLLSNTHTLFHSQLELHTR